MEQEIADTAGNIDIYNRWLKLMNTLEMPENEDTFKALLTAYSEQHRTYHNFKHIEALLLHLDTVAALTNSPYEIELALWFHDAVYDPFSSNNEVASAEWAKRFLTANNMSIDTLNKVQSLILATLHNVVPGNTDESFMIDIDLTILGSDESTYSLFEKNVRREYKHVPFFLYKKKRKDILRSFLARESIYFSQHFYEKYEMLARRNLVNAIATL